ncbi:MAG TPA: tripartite tricarboxylate transporter substrate binding protein [Burkholderiales bacterium]|nr:tripartite tricarboxylate transporter substrate binding protein [Burkholderiales bacterium]
MNGATRSWTLAFAVAVLACGSAMAQEKPANYPARAIRVVVSVAPGAGADAIARATAQMLTDAWGQNAVVDNRSGGGGVIAAETVARSTPDGYTFLSHGDTLMLLSALKRVPFDMRKTFDPVTGLTTQPYVILVNLGLPVKSVKELVAHSQAQALTYAGGAGLGSTVHIGMERLAQLSGAKLLFVPYKGSAPSIVAVMGGEIQLAAASAIAASSAIRTGKVRALAVTSLQRVPSMPDLPTVAEQGYPGFKFTNQYNLYAPAGTPRPIIEAVSRVVSDGMHAPQMAKRLVADGSQPAERTTPEQLRATIAREYAEIEKQVKQLKLKIE